MTTSQTPLVDLMRIHADDVHSAHGHNKTSHLLSQAADEIERLRAELDACKRDVEIVRFLRCGGWEVLQNPKYWTLENKFYGAIAEAMAEVAAEGEKSGDA